MVNFGPVDIHQGIELANKASELCTAEFVSPNLLEFETVKLRSIFINKKRYAAIEIEWVKPGESLEEIFKRAKLTLKGLESKRRDNALIGSDTQKEVISKVLYNGDIAGAEEFVKSTITDVLTDNVDLSKLVITKGLSKTKKQYAKGGTKQQHVELAKKIEKRAHKTGETVPSTGDRVPFVMTAGIGRKTQKHAHKAYERAEDPIYVMKHNVPIDKKYYIEKQIMAATLSVFTAIWAPEECHLLKKAKTSDRKLRELTAYKRLFTGKHMHFKKDYFKESTESFGIAKFVKAKPRCLGCNVMLLEDNVVLCKSCEIMKPFIYTKLIGDKKLKEVRYNQAWTRCQRCQGSMFNIVSCGNRICDNFYHRERVIQDIEEIDKKLMKFK